MDKQRDGTEFCGGFFALAGNKPADRLQTKLEALQPGCGDRRDLWGRLSDPRIFLFSQRSLPRSMQLAVSPALHIPQPLSLIIH